MRLGITPKKLNGKLAGALKENISVAPVIALFTKAKDPIEPNETIVIDDEQYKETEIDTINELVSLNVSNISSTMSNICLICQIYP